MILLISELVEANVNSVCEILNYRKVPWFRWNGESFPLETNVSLEYRTGTTAVGKITHSDRVVAFQDVRAVWNRRQGRSRLPNGLTPVDEDFVVRECTHTRMGAYALLEHASWMNHYRAHEDARNKITQLKYAAGIGLNIPPTILTQSPTEAFRFYQEHNENVICKTINPASFIKPVDGFFRPAMVYTSLLPMELTISDFEGTRLIPTLFQAYIEKSYELRITIIGSKVFTALIDSQKSNQTKIDWRRYDDINTPPYCPYKLPKEMEFKLLLLMKTIKLEFGAIDLIRMKNGDYVFLEINPGGQWGWIEDITGQKITEAIADWLIHRDQQNEN